MAQQPSVGRVVHYVSHGTPPRGDGTQTYPSQCRAAIVTEVPVQVPEGSTVVSLAVLNPSGLFFNHGVPQDEQGHEGGTWHWPERVGQ